MNTIISLLTCLILTNSSLAGWEIETVDTGGCAGRNSSLAYNSSNHPTIAYRSCGGTDLRYAFYLNSH